MSLYRVKASGMICPSPLRRLYNISFQPPATFDLVPCGFSASVHARAATMVLDDRSKGGSCDIFGSAGTVRHLNAHFGNPPRVFIYTFRCHLCGMHTARAA